MRRVVCGMGSEKCPMLALFLLFLSSHFTLLLAFSLVTDDILFLIKH